MGKYEALVPRGPTGDGVMMERERETRIRLSAPAQVFREAQLLFFSFVISSLLLPQGSTAQCFHLLTMHFIF